MKSRRQSGGYASAGKFNLSIKRNTRVKLAESDISYRNVALLKSFLSAGSRILSRRVTKLSAKQHRKVTLQVKLAQFLALLPYCDSHER